MDRNYSLTGSPFSPRNGSKLNMPTSRRNLLPSVSKKASGRFSVSGRGSTTMTSQLVTKTPYHLVETYGAPLPVLVNEALAYNDRSTMVTVGLGSAGHVWLVSGRRLLIWPFRKSGQCRELTLPPTDLAHRAELVTVFLPEGSQVPSCIAVSPEGTVRYWPSVAHEGSSIETTCELHGQECCSLTPISSIGCILATTTCTLLLVQPSISAGRHVINARVLRPPHGWLGGLGRRVTSLFFGGLPGGPSTSPESRLVRVSACNVNNSWRVYVLAEHTLQLWQLTSDGNECLIFECELQRLAREAFSEAICEARPTSTSDLEIWLIDMQTSDGWLMLLVAAANPRVSCQMHYALARIPVDSSDPPSRLEHFHLLKTFGFYSKEGDEVLFIFQRFLVKGAAAFLYDNRTITAVAAETSSADDPSDVIELPSPEDRLLGASICDSTPVWFSRCHGLVSVTAADFPPGICPGSLEATINSIESSVATDISMSVGLGSNTVPVGGLHVTIDDGDLTELSIKHDSTLRFKAAFIYFIKNNRSLVQSTPILNELFPSEDNSSSDQDSALDRCVVNIANELVDDIPGGDPRWSENKTDSPKSSMGLAGSLSLQVSYQLEDKQNALNWFIAFLRTAGLIDRLGLISWHDTTVTTTQVLSEISEKIVAAQAICSFQNGSFAQTIDSAIKSLMVKRGVILTGGLTYKDHFYREVSKCNQLLRMLVHMAEEISDGQTERSDIEKFVCDVAEIITGTVNEILEYRNRQDISDFNGLPWTAASGTHGLLDPLLTLHGVIARLDLGSDTSGRYNELCIHLLTLGDLILSGDSQHVDSTRGTDAFSVLLSQFENRRRELVGALVDAKDLEKAASLAEKYLDFQSMIEICEKTGNSDKFDYYKTKFEEQGFSEFYLTWLVKESHQSRLLNELKSCQSTQQLRAVSRFLKNHPTLSWVHDIQRARYESAAVTLIDLSDNESDRLGRKKSMLSLAKLSLLASDATNETKLNNVNEKLRLVSYQEETPVDSLKALGFSVDNQPVLSPVELINVYLTEENDSLTELDLFKAYGLLDYIADDLLKDELKHRLWCRAIIADQWGSFSVDSPLSIVKETLFFRLANFLMLTKGFKIEDLPSIERIIETSELGNLKNSATFQYLIRFIFEHWQTQGALE